MAEFIRINRVNESLLVNLDLVTKIRRGHSLDDQGVRYTVTIWFLSLKGEGSDSETVRGEEAMRLWTYLMDTSVKLDETASAFPAEGSAEAAEFGFGVATGEKVERHGYDRETDNFQRWRTGDHPGIVAVDRASRKPFVEPCRDVEAS